MHAFDYCAPADLQEALQMVASHSGRVAVLAGGTDLTVAMRLGRKRPDLVVDLKKIPELTQAQARNDVLMLGAAVPCRRIYQSQEVRSVFPALVDSTTLIGGIQIQGRATLGGNLCNAAPSADTVPALMAYGATALVASAKSTRRVPVEQVCIAPGQTCLSADEVITHLMVPVPPPCSGAMFIRFIPRNEMDIAVVNAAAYVELDSSLKTFKNARIAIGSVAPVPLLVNKASELLVDCPVSDASIAQAAGASSDAASPITDMRGTIEHRKHLIKVLVTRALNGAIRRARKDVA
jgi:carbon-monoxide dehydrogenase medium subunit